MIEYYSGRDRPLDEEGVKSHYFLRSAEPTAGGVEEYEPCILEVDGRAIGFVQFYRIRKADSEQFRYSLSERTFGIDLFIGDPVQWGRGLGTRALSLTTGYLQREKGARRVVADPRADNERSIRAFEKAGFRKVKKLPKHEVFEGTPRDCWLMEWP